MQERPRGSASRFAQGVYIRLAAILAVTLALSIRAPAQSMPGPKTVTQPGRVIGTVTDLNGDGVVGATVVLSGPEVTDRRKVVTRENGFFEFDGVKPGVPYQINVRAGGFKEWTSPAITLELGEIKLLGGIPLHLATQNTTVHVTYNRVEAATEQVKAEEKQRVLGIIPNFYVSYDRDAEPLTTKLKFELALKVSVDAVTIAGVAAVAGARQAVNSPNYEQGAAGFGERFGATAADGFTDIMIGGAILPSLLHQDPRYFYQGRGTTGSRLRHALLSPFICRGDDGKWEPNYSSLGGDLASSAIANTYYPGSSRGAGLVFGNFALGTGERIGASVAQEFLLSKLTRRGGHIQGQ